MDQPTNRHMATYNFQNDKTIRGFVPRLSQCQAAMKWWNAIGQDAKDMLCQKHGSKQFATVIDIARFWQVRINKGVKQS
jgi:hypothetical protein